MERSMAIIRCPKCAKSISDKHQHCPHCDSNVAELDSEQIQQIQREQRIQKRQMFINHSFLALILFLGGFFCLYFLQPQEKTFQWYAYIIAIGVGCIWYLINRIALVTLKKKK
jgi:predicted nucleic acid-binding Zn ribbon protein